jgi:interferon-induced GTP-binding protein Mx1
METVPPAIPQSWSNAALGQLFADTSVARWVELPWICVMGETSSGKSTVLSQLSGIELPTDHTLTTKIPTLIQLRHDAVCQAHIQLIPWNHHSRIHNNNQHSDIGEEQHHHKVILTEEQWHEIPLQIRHAQELVTENGDATIRSDWWVSVSIQGPHVSHPFTLVDLPGLIQNSPEHPDIPQQVQALWKSIQHERSILLAVHPSTSDFHNAAVWASSSSSDFITIPVLTKPDLIDPGAESAVVNLLKGQHPLPLKGFHLIKGRGQAALDQSIEQALREEERFFQQQEPWKSITDTTCLGTIHLREKLSRMQLDLWRKTLPSIVQEIRRKRVEASRVMEQYRPIQDRRRYFQEQSQSLVAKLQASIQGRSSYSAGARLHQACTEYADSIRQGSLYTVRSVVEGAHVLVTTPRGVVPGGVVHIDKHFCCVDFIHEDHSSSEALFDRVGIPIQDHKVEVDDVWLEGLKVYIAREGGVCDSLKKIPFHCVRTDPSWLKEKIAATRTDELACFLNVDIFKAVVADFVEADWRPPCDKLLQITEDVARKAVSESIQSTLDERYPLLQSLLERHCRAVVRSLMDHAREQVDMHLAAEKQPYTLDLLLLENIAEARHRSLRRELEIAFRLDQEGGVYDTQAIQAIMDDVFERQKHKTIEDHTAEEMEIILESYGKIATRRVLDRSPMICWEVLRSLIPAIQESFWSVSEEELIECTQDQEDTRTKYIAAREEFEEMEKALRIFESL